MKIIGQLHCWGPAVLTIPLTRVACVLCLLLFKRMWLYPFGCDDSRLVQGRELVCLSCKHQNAGNVQMCKCANMGLLVRYVLVPFRGRHQLIKLIFLLVNALWKSTWKSRVGWFHTQVFRVVCPPILGRYPKTTTRPVCRNPRNTPKVDFPR